MLERGSFQLNMPLLGIHGVVITFSQLTVSVLVTTTSINNSTDIVKVYPGTPLLECIYLCSETDKCNYVGINPSTMTCYLHREGEANPDEDVLTFKAEYFSDDVTSKVRFNRDF